MDDKLEFLKNNYESCCLFSSDGEHWHSSRLCGLSSVCTEFLGFVDENGDEWEYCEGLND